MNDSNITMKNNIPFNSLIIRYGEIALKGKNRRSFEMRLRADIKGFLSARDIPFSEVVLKMGRIYIRGIQTLPPMEKVFGVLSYSPALEIEKDIEHLKEKVKHFVPLIASAKSFRVSCQRVDKKFPFTSVQIERDMGEILYTLSSVPVNLKAPELDFQIEIGETGIYIFAQKIPGYGGMPFGTAGKLVSLISSGIDSPVATFLMMKRGVEPILLHYKITEEDTAKVYLLKEKLEEYSGGRKLKLIVIPRADLFNGKFDQFYHSFRHQPYLCIMCKYLMHQKAGEIVEQENAYGIITGDNLAQVASQTLQNLFAYHTISGKPIYSPLISFEKDQTIKIAREIGTYDLSIIPAQGCIPPPNPKTRVNKEIFIKMLKETGFVKDNASGSQKPF